MTSSTSGPRDGEAIRPRTGFWFGFIAAIVKPFMVVFTKRDWRGIENLRGPGGIILATNHVSHFDPLALGHFLYDNGRVPRYLAKASLFKIPVFGRIITNAGQIPVLRGTTDAAHAYGAAVDAVNRGECVVFYPEGTITKDPDRWPMTGKTGAARIALQTGRPVIPVAQWGPNEVYPPYSHKIRLLPRKTMRMSAGKPVDLSAFEGHPLTNDLLHKATTVIMNAIATELGALRGAAPPAELYDPRTARRAEPEPTDEGSEGEAL